jgi:hypothetical protein
MFFSGTIQKHVDSIPWQDYRGSDSGMVVPYSSDPVSELPIREVPEEWPSDVIADPNYETGTFGLYGCGKANVRNAFFKAKMRYLFFMAKYEGANAEYLDRFLITGFYRINWTADVQKLHIRYLNEYSCIGTSACMALRADESHFVSLDDAYEVTAEQAEAWGSSSRITRQSRFSLDEEQTSALLEHLRSKENIVEEYIQETKRLQPQAGEEEEEEEEE